MTLVYYWGKLILEFVKITDYQFLKLHATFNKDDKSLLI